MKLSIVIPVYNSEKILDKLLKTIKNAILKKNYPFELLLINDCSSDKSWQKILQLKTKYKFIKAINLKYNYGQHGAIFCGLRYSTGDNIVCMDDDMPRNSESQMISATVRWMKENTECLFLYTMADGIMGKCGYVYQASNFYFGEKYWTQVYLMENGEKLHPRSTKELCKENAKFSGREKIFWMTTDFMKHKGIRKINGYMFRYIYPLNKKAKKLMKNGSTLERGRNYPKEKDLKWVDVTDMKNKSEIDRPAFTFEDAKYNQKIYPFPLEKFIESA